MKRVFYAIILAAGLAAGPVCAGTWSSPGFYLEVQAPKGRSDPPPGAERGERRRDAQQERREERRERLTDDERRSLHRDLDKANRELYGRRPQK